VGRDDRYLEHLHQAPAAVPAVVFLALSGHLTPTPGLRDQDRERDGSVASSLRGLLHKPPVTTWGEAAARFRRDTIVLVGHRWLRLSLMTVLSQVALFFVLLLSLRHLGVSEREVSTSEAFAV
jgi:hypothetical protein